MRIVAMVAKATMGVGLAAALVLAAPAVASADDVGAAAKLSHGEATAKFEEAGVTWSSSGGCSDREQPNCTSFEQVNSESVEGAIALQEASGCSINVTGGTETGHADGEYSHWNGYKLDFGMESCLSDYITSSFTSIGGDKWEAPSGNIYYDEANHWDVTFYNCGC